MKMSMSLVFLFLPALSLAQVTKDQLFEMLDKGVDHDLILSLIKKDCVGFDIDAKALVELSQRVPKPILQAAMDCSKSRKGHASKRETRTDIPENLPCAIYKELSSNPELRDFPLVVENITNGYVTVIGVDETIWARGKTNVALDYFRYLEAHEKYKAKAIQTIKRVPSVKGVKFRVYSKASTEEVRKMQKASMQDVCSPKGKVNVVSTPKGAIVLVDGKKIGSTPVTLDVVTGSHSLRLEKPDYAPYEGRIAIEEGKTETVKATMEILPKLILSTKPDGATILIDGHDRGRTPLELHLPAGKHTLRIDKSGYLPYEKEIALQEDNTPISISMERLSELEVRSNPGGARVTVNGDDKGVTPLTLFLDKGEYDIQVHKRRHSPFSTTVGIELGQTKTIEAELPARPRSDCCYVLDLKGKVAPQFDALKTALLNKELNLSTSLCQVVTSQLKRRLESTHVVNGVRILYEPKFGEAKIENPEDLKGRKLGGLAFGEYVSDVVYTPPGKVRVSDLSKKKNTIRMEVQYPDGVKNSVFFDFDRGLRDLDFDDFYDAMCFVFPKDEVSRKTNTLPLK